MKDALARVGLRPGKRPHPHDAIPDSALIARLKEVARELGHTPTLREIGVAGPYSAKLYVARFGGWNRALAKARLAPRRRRRAASKDEIRRYLDAFVARGGHPPSVEDLRSDPWAPRMSAIAKRFGGLREAIEDAGLGADHLPPSWDDFDDAALVAALQELARRIGRAPDSKLAEWLDGFPGPRVYAERFGSWFDALRAAELDSVHKRFRARDGHVCESAAERLVDDFLTGNGIQHEIHVRYAAHPVLNPDRRYVADWQLDDGTLVEYFGVVNRPDYDRRRAHKEALADALGIRLVSITPRALGPGKLEALLADYL